MNGSVFYSHRILSSSCGAFMGMWVPSVAPITLGKFPIVAKPCMVPITAAGLWGILTSVLSVSARIAVTLLMILLTHDWLRPTVSANTF